MDETQLVRTPFLLVLALYRLKRDKDARECVAQAKARNLESAEIIEISKELGGGGTDSAVLWGLAVGAGAAVVGGLAYLFRRRK
jgi:LPXTG-motif cell wall-anchored protein